MCNERGKPTVLTLALTTPLPPTSGARFLPRSGVNRQDLCCPPRSNGVSVAEFGRWCRPATIAQSSKVVGVVEGLVVGQCDAPREETAARERVDESDPGGGESGERSRRGRGHAALRTRRTSEWVEKDGCLCLGLSFSHSLVFSFSLSLLLPPPVAPSSFPSYIFLASTRLVERQRNGAWWRGESRLTTRRNATTALSLQRSNRQAVWTFLSSLSLLVLFFLLFFFSWPRWLQSTAQTEQPRLILVLIDSTIWSSFNFENLPPSLHRCREEWKMRDGQQFEVHSVKKSESSFGATAPSDSPELVNSYSRITPWSCSEEKEVRKRWWWIRLGIEIAKNFSQMWKPVATFKTSHGPHENIFYREENRKKKIFFFFLLKISFATLEDGRDFVGRI